MESPKVINVRIGELKMGESPSLLQATLGSCVGIAYIWPEQKLFGLAHCLLPKAPVGGKPESARFVDQAFAALQELMKIPTHRLSELQVYLAGGGYMIEGMGDKESTHHIGALNSEEALRVSKEMKLQVVRTDFGGNQGRKIIIDCATGQVEINKIPHNRSLGRS